MKFKIFWPKIDFFSLKIFFPILPKMAESQIMYLVDFFLFGRKIFSNFFFVILNYFFKIRTVQIGSTNYVIKTQNNLTRCQLGKALSQNYRAFDNFSSVKKRKISIIIFGLYPRKFRKKYLTKKNLSHSNYINFIKYIVKMVIKFVILRSRITNLTTENKNIS